MKIVKNKTLPIWLIGLLILASCVHELTDEYKSSHVSLTLEEAQKAFEKEATYLNIKPFTKLSGTRENKKAPIITPLWKKGQMFSNEEGTFVVVPFNTPLIKTFARKHIDIELSDDEKYYNTDIRLLIQKKENNEYLYSVVYLTGDLSYIVEAHQSIKALRLDKLDSFSGSIRYFNLKGEMLWGTIYKDGEEIGRISIAETSPNNNSRGSSQTRGYETFCESHLFEYETCYHYGYDLGEGYEESGVDCTYEYQSEEVCYTQWVDDGEASTCPYCGSIGCMGICQSTTPSQPDPAVIFNNIKKKLDEVTKEKLGERKFTIKSGTVRAGGLAVATTMGSLATVLYKNTQTDVVISNLLNELQLKIVMAHEYMHLILYEISRKAGSATALATQNKELYDLIESKKDAQQAHHEYMSKHVNEAEKNLRDAFPGESEDFYKYGKWGGGATLSGAFNKLPQNEQKQINIYLSNNKL